MLVFVLCAIDRFQTPITGGALRQPHIAVPLVQMAKVQLALMGLTSPLQVKAGHIKGYCVIFSYKIDLVPRSILYSENHHPSDGDSYTL